MASAPTNAMLRFSLLFATSSQAFAAEYKVDFNDSPYWTVGSGVYYLDMTLTLGNTISFLSSDEHDVVLLNKPSSGSPFDLCTKGAPVPADNYTKIFNQSDFPRDRVAPRHFTPPTCGEFYMACSVSRHCANGQRVKVVVRKSDGSNCSDECIDAACVTTESKATKTDTSKIFGVVPVAPGVWGVGPYSDMVMNMTDTLVFVTNAIFHDVVALPDLDSFNSCDLTKFVYYANWNNDGTPSANCTKNASTCCANSSCTEGPGFGTFPESVTFTFKPTAPGDYYFTCSIERQDCLLGQKVRVKVNGATTTPAVSVSHAAKSLSQLWGISSWLVALGWVAS